MVTGVLFSIETSASRNVELVCNILCSNLVKLFFVQVQSLNYLFRKDPCKFSD